MKIGTGLPTTIPGIQGRTLIEFATKAEERGFSTLATIDRIAYPNYDSLIALAAAAGATSRIGLLTNIILAPTRNPALLAKETASLDQLSGGRLTLGTAVGSREDDYLLTGQDFHTRGKDWDEALELLHKAWKGEPVGASSQPIGPLPTRPGGVPLLMGGSTQAALDRMVRWGEGWTAGGAPPDMITPFVEKIHKAWEEGGREGKPRLVALSYFALGENAQARAAAYLTDYYGGWGGGLAQAIPKSPDALKEIAKRFEDVGFDELIFSPTIAEIRQLEQLADAVLS